MFQGKKTQFLLLKTVTSRSPVLFKTHSSALGMDASPGPVIKVGNEG